LLNHLHLRYGWPKLLLWPLWPILWGLSMIYSLIVQIKNRRWDYFPPKRSHPAYVISVGNLSAGGTGKTPMGLALVKWLEEKGLKVEVVLRGYGASQGFSDEAELYRKAVGEDGVHQEADRVLALERMVSKEADIVLLDDAFQHRRVHRDLDLVLWDLSAPQGESEALPLGLLREPMKGLERADAVVLTRSERVSEEERERVCETFKERGWGEEQFLASSQPLGLMEWPSGAPLEYDGEPCFLVSGIGRPEAFLITAKKMGLRIMGHNWFADHHPFSQDDILNVWLEAEKAGAERIVLTSKDVVKWKGTRSVGVLEIEMKVEEGFWPWLQEKMEVARDE